MFHSPPQVRAEILERSSHSYLLEEHSDKLSSYPSQWNWILNILSSPNVFITFLGEDPVWN